MLGRYLVWCLVVGGILTPAQAEDPVPLSMERAFREIGLKPGRWHTSIKLDSFELTPTKLGDAVPEGIQANLQGKVGQSFETDDCIGSGLAENGDLILPGIKLAAECTLEKSDASGGHLALNATCGGDANRFASGFEVSSTYSDENMTSQIFVRGKARSYNVELRISSVSHITGQCGRE